MRSYRSGKPKRYFCLFQMGITLCMISRSLSRESQQRNSASPDLNRNRGTPSCLLLPPFLERERVARWTAQGAIRLERKILTSEATSLQASGNELTTKKKFSKWV